MSRKNTILPMRFDRKMVLTLLEQKRILLIHLNNFKEFSLIALYHLNIVRARA